ncbi:glutamine amidotransferase [Rhodopirellula sp. JC740]|uniref:Glutamine amidotransferase n=1 Tax=Rhodopirellula halodulae TaxID=2894198 RepID=A0ABS8NHI0_9BACT|nr:glutamine amidotransferase [Rhodopirellula sp. JC740]MCC9642283.1 glutamine amidotransferase [Rhodopirellula sp. JC740]
MSWGLEPIYGSLPIALALVAIIVAMMFVILPPGVSGRRRQVLLTLRGLASIALVLVLLRPSLVQSDNRPAAATLAIALDTSASMELSSGEAMNRWQQQKRSAQKLISGLSGSDQALQVVVMGFDEAAQSIHESGTEQLATIADRIGEQEHTGRATDLAAPLTLAMDRGRTSPLAGVVMFSDGTQIANSREASADVPADPQREARLLGAMGVPVWTVPLGPPDEASRRIDLSVESLPETLRMFTGNESLVAFQVRSRGVVQSPVKVSLRWLDENGQTATAATRTITPDKMDQVTSLEIPIVAPKPGQYRLIAEVETRTEETITDNNSQVAFVDVREGGGRVLYLEGTPRLEQKDLRWALGQFLDLELTYRWIPRDTVNSWPIDLVDDFSPGRYDVIILGDLHSAALGDEQLQQLSEAVGQGTALIMLGGEHTYSRGGYANTPLANVLPVQLDDRLRQPPGPLDPVEATVSDAMRSPVTMQPATSHPITSIQVMQRDRLVRWEDLPAMPGVNPWPSVRVAPGVQVLLQSPQQQPLMVIGEYGRGRVAALAFDSTWTWRRAGLGDFHRRFWRQLILWSLAREEDASLSLQLQLSPRRFVGTEQPSFTATDRSDAESNGSNRQLVAEVILESGETIPVPIGGAENSGRQAERIWSGKLPELPPGFHRLKVRSDGADAESLEPAEVAFQVLDDTRELTTSQTDHSLLRQLADATSGVGGRVYQPEDVDALVETIRSRRTESVRTVIEKFRLGDGPLSGWLIFLLFAGALSVEWALRRQWGLA